MREGVKREGRREGGKQRGRVGEREGSREGGREGASMRNGNSPCTINCKMS